MAAFAFVAPIVPGKEEIDANAIEQATSGEHRDAYMASRRAAGVTREAVWHQKAPDGTTLAIILIEADDTPQPHSGTWRPRTMSSIAASAPWSRRFTASILRPRRLPTCAW